MKRRSIIILLIFCIVFNVTSSNVIVVNAVEDNDKDVEQKDLLCLKGVKEVESSGYFSVKLNEDGTVWCTGYNGSGNLGDGTNIDKTSFVKVKNLTDVKTISTGDGHTLALKKDGTVWAWGCNYGGQLGDNSKESRNVPVKVQGLENIKEIYATINKSFAIDSRGRLWAWGKNSYGELGNGNKQDQVKPFMSNLTNIKQIACGSHHTLALKKDGTVWAWGKNNENQIQQGLGVEERITPTRIDKLKNIKQVAANRDHSLALNDKGIVFGWGKNENKQLGPSRYDTQFDVSEISNLEGVSSIYAGDDFTLFLRHDGSVCSVGNNLNGQLGDGTTENSESVRFVKVLENVVDLDAEDSSAIAVNKDGYVYTWGNNDHGQLGDNSKINKAVPSTIKSYIYYTQIAYSGRHTLVVKSDGTVWAWGSNDNGQLGDGTTNHNSKPKIINGLNDITAVAVGQRHSLALGKDGKVWAWGNNNFGQIGDNTESDRHTPVQVIGLSDIIAIDAGEYYSMALNKNGRVYLWGRNNEGQLGYSITENCKIPRLLSQLAYVTKISAGKEFCLALIQNKTVWGWGNNESGQLGIGHTTNTYNPQQINNFENIIDISAGYYHSLALDENGQVWSWGTNYKGALGNGLVVDSYTPIKPHIKGKVKSIEAGLWTSYAIKEDGTLWGWGENKSNKIHYEDYEKYLLPVNSFDLCDVRQISVGSSYRFYVLRDDYSIIESNHNEMLGMDKDAPMVTAKYENNNIILSWISVSSANDYQIEINGEIIDLYDNKRSYTIENVNKELTYRIRANYFAWTVNEPTDCSYNWVNATSIKATWDTNHNPKTVQYALAALDENNNMVAISDFTTENFAYLTDLDNNKDYVFRVMAKNEDNKLSKWVDINLPTVEELKINESEEKTKLTWAKLPDKYQYQLKCNDEYLYTGIEENEYTIESLDSYGLKKYEVRAMLKQDNETYYGKWSVLKHTNLGEIKTKKISNCSLQVNFTPKDSDLVRYCKVIVDNKDYTSWHTIKQNSFIFHVDELLPHKSYSVVLKCKLKNGSQYNVFAETVQLNSYHEIKQKVKYLKTQIAANQNIELKWQPCEVASSYEIMRNNKVIATNVTDANYIDTTVDITKLQHYRVRAVCSYINSSSYGPWSNSATFVPQEIELPTVTSGSANICNEGIKISWPQVAGANSYNIKTNTKTIELNSTNSYYLDTESDIYQIQQYSIQAIFGNGEKELISEFGAIIVYKPMLNRPGEVKTGYAYLGREGFINLQWQKAYPADIYEIRIDGQDENYSRTNTPLFKATQSYDINVNHTFEIRAICGDDHNSLYGEWSPIIEYIAPITPPDKVENLKTESTGKNIKLTWLASERAEQYEIEVNGKSILTLNTLEYSYTHCEYNVPYIFRIRAFNKGGYSSWVTSDIVVIDQPIYTELDIPVITQKYIDKNEVSLQWRPVTGAERYLLTLKEIISEEEDPVSVKEIECGDKPYVVLTGLENNTNYQIELRAENKNCISQVSKTGLFKTYYLSTPRVISAEPSIESSSIHMTWSAIDNAEKYIIKVNSVNGERLIEVESTETIIKDLESSTAYTLKVKAWCSEGESNFSNKRVAYTWSDKILRNVNAIASKNSIKLSWDSLTPKPQGYEVEVDGVIIDNGADNYYSFHDLKPYTQHTLRVRAKFTTVTTNWSREVTIFTLPDLDTYPHNIIISTDALPVISWNEMPGAIGYNIEIDGVKKDIGDSLKYVNKNRYEGTENKYRVQAYYPYGYGLWSPLIINNSLRANSQKGKTLELGLVGEHIVDFNKYKLQVSYNHGVLEVEDLCTMNSISNLTEGKIEGTNITITKFLPGKIEFEVENTHDNKYAWTGVINSIKFKGKLNGGTYINYTVFEQPLNSTTDKTSKNQ